MHREALPSPLGGIQRRRRTGAFHLPLYRQCQIFAHAGLTLSRTTLIQWVGASSELLGPLAAALAKHVLAAPNINADVTPIKVLAPGTGKTKKGRLWAYVRDGRGWGSTDPPAVWYRYSSSWHGKYPQQHLAGFEGKLQVDVYAGFEPLFVPSKPGVIARVLEIACWAQCAASGSTCTRPIPHRSPERRWTASANCTKSRRPSAVNRPLSGRRRDRSMRCRCSPRYMPG